MLKITTKENNVYMVQEDQIEFLNDFVLIKKYSEYTL